MGDLQDPIYGGTLVPYFRPYFVGIFPETWVKTWDNMAIFPAFHHAVLAWHRMALGTSEGEALLVDSRKGEAGTDAASPPSIMGC